MRILSMMLTFFLFACGDKDTDKPVDTADTSDSSDTSDSLVDTSDSSDSSDTQDTEPATTCLDPEFTNQRAFAWKDPQRFGGFTATVSATHALIANVIPGYFYGISWSSESGYIEDVADFTLVAAPDSLDKAMYSEGYVGITDAYAYDVGGVSGGAVYFYSDEDIAGLSGTLTLEESAPLAFYGENEDGWTGAMVLWDVDSDSNLDVVVGSGPFPGDIAIFSDFNSYLAESTPEAPRHVSWSEADFVLEDVCRKGIFAPNNMKIFGKGSGDGFLAIGCPSSDYKTGEVLIYDLPLSEKSKPAFYITKVTGWRMDSNGYAEPLYVESKGSNTIAMVKQNSPTTLDLQIIYAPNEDTRWWGSSPAMTQFVNEYDETCSYLAAGDQQYTYKSVQTGALFATLIGPDYLATEWIEMSMPSSEVGDPLYIGAVNEFSPDGNSLITTGWERSYADAGGMILTEVVY